MVIWDGLFASVSADSISPSSSSTSQEGFELALWISVAMLIRIRNHRGYFVYSVLSLLTTVLPVIPGDYTAQLTSLLRYPPPSSLGASSQGSNAPGLLLSQAQLLLTSPTPGTGASLVMQNRNELGIPVEVPDPPTPPPTRRRRASAIAATAPPTVSASHGRMPHAHDRPRLQDMITNRLMDANESLGIQRGFFNTITELRVRSRVLVFALSVADSCWAHRETFLIFRRHLSGRRRGTDLPSRSSTSAPTRRFQLEAPRLLHPRSTSARPGSRDHARKWSARLWSFVPC
jgi:hypothetical protein